MDNNRSLRQLVTSLPFIGTSLVIGFIIILILLPDKKNTSYEKNESVKQPWENSSDEVITSNFSKNLDEIKVKLSRLENLINTKTLFKADDIDSLNNLWTNTISDYTRSIFKNSSLDLDILVSYVTGNLKKLPDDVTNKANANQLNILFTIQAQNDLFKIEVFEMATNYKKLLTDKVKKYIEIHGQEKYNKLLADYKSRKIDTEGMFKELENTTPTKETP